MATTRSRFFKKSDESARIASQSYVEDRNALEKTLLFYYFKDQTQHQQQKLFYSLFQPWVVVSCALGLALAWTVLDDRRMINMNMARHMFTPYSGNEIEEKIVANFSENSANQKIDSQKRAVRPLPKIHALVRDLSSLEGNSKKNQDAAIVAVTSMRFVPIDISWSNKAQSKMKIVTGHLVIKSDLIEELYLEIKDQDNHQIEIDVESEQLKNGLFRYSIGDQPLSGTIVRSNTQEYVMSFINGDLKGVQILFSVEEKLLERERVIQEKQQQYDQSDTTEIERDPETQRQLSSVENDDKEEVPNTSEILDRQQFIKGQVVRDPLLDDERSMSEDNDGSNQVTALEERYQTVLEMKKNGGDQELKNEISEENERTNGEFGF